MKIRALGIIALLIAVLCLPFDYPAHGQINNQIKCELKTTLNGYKGAENGMAFHPNGRLLAAITGNWEVKIWDIASEREVKVLEVLGDDRKTFEFKGRNAEGDYVERYTEDKNIFRSLAFSRDGKMLAIQKDIPFIVDIVDTESWEVLKTITTGQNVDPSVDFSPDGRFIAEGSCNNAQGGACAMPQITLWNIQSGEVAKRLTGGHKAWVFVNKFSPDGKYLASSAWDDTVKLWDISSGKALATLKAGSSVHSIAFSPDSRYAAYGDYVGYAKVFSVPQGKVVKTLEGRPESGWNRAWSVAFSPDGKMLASSTCDGPLPNGCQHGIIRIYTTSTWNLSATVSSNSFKQIYSIAFSPDSRLLAAAGTSGRNGGVEIYEISNDANP